jgi:hypothetical protein
MPANYVIVLQSAGALVTRSGLDFTGDLAALVTARRLFIEALIVTAARPVSLLLGRQEGEGAVDWLNTWRSERT